MPKPLPTVEQYESFLLARAQHIERAAKEAPWGDPEAARGAVWQALEEASHMDTAFFAIFGAYPAEVACAVYPQSGGE